MVLGYYTEIITCLIDAHQIQGVVAGGSVDIHQQFCFRVQLLFVDIFMSGKFGVRHMLPIAHAQGCSCRAQWTILSFRAQSLFLEIFAGQMQEVDTWCDWLPLHKKSGCSCRGRRGHLPTILSFRANRHCV